jgi:ribonuclease P protein component
MQRRFRLRNSADFENLRRHGKAWHHRLVTLVITLNDQPTSRFGFIASRRVGDATVRNKVKRLLREGVRPRINQIDSGWDCLFIAKPAAAGAKLNEIDTVIDRLLQSAGLLLAID